MTFALTLLVACWLVSAGLAASAAHDLMKAD